MNEYKSLTLKNIKYDIVLCSVKGKDKQCNQDSVKIYSDDNQIICVLADGLGSAINSQEGSRIICEKTVELLKSIINYDTFIEDLREKWMHSLIYKPESCDTTVKFVIVKNNQIIYGGIGDGWINGIVDNEFFEVKNGNNFANQTESMMTIGYKNRFKIYKKDFKKFKVASLATDGFSEDFKTEMIKDFLLDSVKELKTNGNGYASSLENFICNWPIKSNQDDKSIIIIGGNKIE